MANPSPAAIAAIRKQVDDWSPDDAALAATLNEPTVPDPAPQATVPTPFTTAQAFGLLSPASAGKMNTIAFLPDIRDKIAANDRTACGLYVGLLTAGGVITPAERAALLGLLSAAGPDPSWQSKISWAGSVIGRAVDADDIAASRPGV